MNLTATELPRNHNARGGAPTTRRTAPRRSIDMFFTVLPDDVVGVAETRSASTNIRVNSTVIGIGLRSLPAPWQADTGGRR